MLALLLATQCYCRPPILRFLAVASFRSVGLDRLRLYSGLGKWHIGWNYRISSQVFTPYFMSVFCEHMIPAAMLGFRPTRRLCNQLERRRRKMKWNALSVTGVEGDVVARCSIWFCGADFLMKKLSGYPQRSCHGPRKVFRSIGIG